jgi:hypothetical protein
LDAVTASTSPPTKAASDQLRIAAGVVHYRAWPEVRSTIDGLLAQTRRPDELVLLDHASGDGSPSHIRAAYPQLDLVEAPDNRGPAGGLQRLVKELLSRDVDAVFLLPDDIELAPDALEQLAARLDGDPGLGAVGPLVAHQRARDVVFYAGGDINRRTWDLKFREQPSRLADWKGTPPQEVDFLETGGILVRSAAALSAGPIAEHFYYILDDVDFTLQMRAKGWKLECVPAAVAWQDLGDSSRETLLTPISPYLAVRNRLGLLARNAPRRMLARELLRVVSWLVRDAVRPRTGSRAGLKPAAMGLVDFCRGRWGPPPAGV